VKVNVKVEVSSLQRLHENVAVNERLGQERDAWLALPSSTAQNNPHGENIVHKMEKYLDL
jgi:hypothetical protein